MINLNSKIFTPLPVAVLVMALAMMVPLSAAEAGGKKKFFRHFGNYKNPYLLKYDYICQPRYVKRWVYSPRLKRKVRRWINFGERCNMHYH